MKTEQIIREKFEELVVQRDSCTKGSAVREMLTQRIMALGWVIDHHLVPEIRMSQVTLDFMGCVA